MLVRVDLLCFTVTLDQCNGVRKWERNNTVSLIMDPPSLPDLPDPAQITMALLPPQGMFSFLIKITPILLGGELYYKLPTFFSSVFVGFQLQKTST